MLTTVWELDADDIEAVEAELGKAVLSGKTCTVYKTYEEEGTTWTLHAAVSYS